MCCGSQRTAIRTAAHAARMPTPARNNVSPAPPPAPALKTQREVPCSVLLHYINTPPIRVWGQITGQGYQFSGSQPKQSVHCKDAIALMTTGLFRRV